jgi:hypothetical protein
MWEEKVLTKSLDNYFENTKKEQFICDLKEADSLHLVEDVKEQPYLVGFEVRKISLYNPNFGDDKICECGHSYYRHFDSWENMFPCGCKYCRCHEFKEKSGETNDKDN